jgi:hypothetical protein
MEIAGLFFSAIGLLATIGFGIWGGTKIVRKFRSKTISTYSPRVKGNSNVVTINAQSPEVLQALQQLVKSSTSPVISALPPNKAVAEFKAAMTSNSDSLTALLLKAAEAAKTLGRHEDLRWIEKELTGYYATDAEMFPDYRKVEFQLSILFPDKSGFSRPMTLPFPVQWGANIAEIERCQKEFANNPEAQFTGNAPLQPWMREVPLQNVFGDRETVPVVFGAKQVKQLTDGLRRRLHLFFLDLPTAG